VLATAIACIIDVRRAEAGTCRARAIARRRAHRVAGRFQLRPSCALDLLVLSSALHSLRAPSAVSRQAIIALASNGFLNKQIAPLAVALASSPGSALAVIMIIGIFEPRDLSNRARSRPLMPGMWISVMTQSNLSDL